MVAAAASAGPQLSGWAVRRHRSQLPDEPAVLSQAWA